MDTLTSEDIVEGVLHKYSSGDETHCRKSELKRDLVRIMESYRREAESVQEMHDAWLRIHGDIERERSKPLLKRLFTSRDTNRLLREEFEAEFGPRGYDMRHVPQGHNFGHYIDDMTEGAWRGWQAALKSNKDSND